MNIELSELGRHEAWLRLSSIFKTGDKYIRLERKLTSELIKNWRESYEDALKELFRQLPNEISSEAIGIITQRLADALGQSFGNSQKVREEFREYITRAYESGKSEFAIKSELSLSDIRAIDILTKHNCYWLGEHYDKHIGSKIAELTQNALSEGLGRNELAKELRKSLGGEAGGYEYWDVVSSAALVRSRSFGCISGMVEAGITEYEILAMGDERMCPICGELSGQTFSVVLTHEVIDRMLEISDPEKFKEAMPWHTEPPIGVSKDKLIADGMSIPPFHGRCRCVLVMASEARESTLEIADGLFPDTAESLRDAFIDSPKFIQNLYTQHKDTLFGIFLDADANSAYYSMVDKIIYLFSLSETKSLLHEFGHHVDNSMNEISSSQIFLDAIKISMDSIKGKGKYKAQLRDKMRGIMLDGEAFNNSYLSDIFCAVARADNRKKDLWGVAGHRASYFRDEYNIRSEVFADLFLLYAQRDTKAITHVKNVFPDIINAFLKITGGSNKK